VPRIPAIIAIAIKLAPPEVVAAGASAQCPDIDRTAAASALAHERTHAPQQYALVRNELKAAAKRLTEIGSTGVKFLPEEQIPGPPASVAATTIGTEVKVEEAGARLNLQTFIGQVTALISGDQLQPAIDRVRTNLVEVARNNPSDQIQALLYNTASLNVQLFHEGNYTAIFGSQLNVSAQANGAGGLVLAVPKQIYEQAKLVNPLLYASFTFETWIGFITRSSLLNVAANGNYVLTNYGRGFLKYLVDRQLSVFKPY
jgi:hypothetical protein